MKNKKNKLTRTKGNKKNNHELQNKYSQIDLYGNSQEANNTEIWGYNPERKAENTIQIGFQNIGMQKISHKAYKLIENSKHISNHLQMFYFL